MAPIKLLPCCLVLLATTACAQLHITTTTVPTANQYQPYTTTLAATAGASPYHWSVDRSSGVSLPEGMNLDPATGVSGLDYPILYTMFDRLVSFDPATMLPKAGLATKWEFVGDNNP